MSGSGGGQQTTQSLPSWAEPYAQQILQRGSALSNQDIPQYGGQTIAGMSPDQQAAMDMVRQRATGGSQAIDAATGAVTGMLGNQGNPFAAGTNPYASQTTNVATNPYIGQNPYLAQQVQQAQDQTAKNYATGTAAQTMGQFRNSGAFGGSAMQEYQDTQNQQLGQTLGNMANSAYMQDYANTQQLAQRGIELQTGTSLADAARNAQYTQAGQQLGASSWDAAQNRLLTGAGVAQNLGNQGYMDASQLLQMGNMGQAQNQNEMNAAYQTWLNNAMQPYQKLGILQNSLSGAMGAGAQGITSTSGGGGSTLGSVGGGAMSGAAMGSMIMPGWGTAIGAGAGGLMGLLNS